MTLYVTDHAVIRYLERVLHLDMDKVRDDVHGERVVTVIGRREIERSKHWMGDVLEAAE